MDATIRKRIKELKKDFFSDDINLDNKISDLMNKNLVTEKTYDILFDYGMKGSERLAYNYMYKFIEYYIEWYYDNTDNEPKEFNDLKEFLEINNIYSDRFYVDAIKHTAIMISLNYDITDDELRELYENIYHFCGNDKQFEFINVMTIDDVIDYSRDIHGDVKLLLDAVKCGFITDTDGNIRLEDNDYYSVTDDEILEEIIEIGNLSNLTIWLMVNYGYSMYNTLKSHCETSLVDFLDCLSENIFNDTRIA